MKNNIVIRAFQKPLEIRSVKRSGYLDKGLQGYAVVYGVESRDMGGWKEIIQRGALKDALAKGMDVRMLYQHDSRQVLAREAAGNLTLREDNDGVFFTADLLDTQFNRDVMVNVEARNLDAMSFGMPSSSMKTRWERATNEVRCFVEKTDIAEISVVTWAAYEETSVAARCAEEYKNFLQQDAVKTTPVGILRARHAVAKRRFTY